MADILSSATLLLTLIGLIYSVWYPELMEVLEIKVPEYREDRKKPLRKVRSAFTTKALPLAIFSTLLTLAFTPIAISVVRISIRTFLEDPWSYMSKYDPVSTVFFLVIVGTAIFAVHLIFVFVHLWILLRRLDA
jgi:hypothetical protein